MRIVAMGEGWARGELHTEVRHGNPMGIVHGGVYCTMMDQVAGTAACSRGRAVPYRHLRRAVPGGGRGRRYADLPRGGSADGSQHRGDAGVGGGRRRHRVRRWHLHLPHEGRKMKKRGALPLGKRPSFYVIQNSRPYLSDRGRRTDSGQAALVQGAALIDPAGPAPARRHRRRPGTGALSAGTGRPPARLRPPWKQRGGPPWGRPAPARRTGHPPDRGSRPVPARGQRRRAAGRGASLWRRAADLCAAGREA